LFTHFDLSDKHFHRTKGKSKRPAKQGTLSNSESQSLPTLSVVGKHMSLQLAEPLIGNYGVPTCALVRQLSLVEKMKRFPTVLLDVVASYVAPTLMQWRFLKQLCGPEQDLVLQLNCKDSGVKLIWSSLRHDPISIRFYIRSPTDCTEEKKRCLFTDIKNMTPETRADLLADPRNLMTPGQETNTIAQLLDGFIRRNYGSRHEDQCQWNEFWLKLERDLCPYSKDVEPLNIAGCMGVPDEKNPFLDLPRPGELQFLTMRVWMYFALIINLFPGQCSVAVLESHIGTPPTLFDLPSLI